MTSIIKARERDAILQSLRVGVVPRIGLQHIQVGRKDEVSAILDDFNRVLNGGAFIRFIIGRFGAGKSFFLNLAKVLALEKKLVVLQADITTERRLHATSGQARALFTELLLNMSTKAKPEGGAFINIIENWISNLEYKLKSTNSDKDIYNAINDELRQLQDFVSGYDFSYVLGKYYEAFQKSDESLMRNALRWLRAEYSTKTEAREDLGVRNIIDDSNIYSYIKLIAKFVTMAGYNGIVVCLDEMGVLSHRLNNAQARNSNYEMILRIVNDCLQGSVSHLGFIFAGTDSFLDDRRRGMYSYEALATRLAENTFAINNNIKDFSGPVIRLNNLSPEDLYILLSNIRKVFASGDEKKYLVSDMVLEEFIKHCSNKLGASVYQTPRDATKSFVGFLSVLEQNPNVKWETLLGSVEIEQSKEELSDNSLIEQDDELTSFKL